MSCARQRRSPPTRCWQNVMISVADMCRPPRIIIEGALQSGGPATIFASEGGIFIAFHPTAAGNTAAGRARRRAAPDAEIRRPDRPRELHPFRLRANGAGLDT